VCLYPTSLLIFLRVGVLLDLIECLIQRDFDYRTRDIRVAYKHIKKALLTEELKKVVVVAHSQGGIVISMALDNLLSDLPRECYPPSLPTHHIDFNKLEIYTFGSAANHFNNPKLVKSEDSLAAISYLPPSLVVEIGISNTMQMQRTPLR